MDFIHLHNHSDYSYLDGLGKIKEYVAKAKELGFQSFALTDHGNIDGTLKFYKECKKNNIKPILGAELYIVKDVNIRDRKEERGHITLLVKNETGWINLKKLVTYSNIYGFYYRPRIDIETLLKYKDGLIIMTACIGSFINFDWGMDLLKSLDKENLYIELMPHNFKEQREYNSKCLELLKEGYKPIATNDCHYVEKHHSKSQEVLLAIQTKQTWNDPNRLKFSGNEFYLKTRREMIRSFEEQGTIDRDIYLKAIENTLEVNNECNLVLEKKEINLPKINLCYDNEDKFLYELIMVGLKEKEHLFENKEIYHKRIEHEFELIVKNNFVRYFLIVWELVNWCKENNILNGPGRGSASGSLICYLLGITKVDPIKYNLVFTRFISPDRIDLPDIDIDFEDVKRPLIKKHLEELYGENNVAGICTHSTMKGKSALRDVSRVFDIPLIDVNKICSVIEAKLDGEDGSGETIKEATDNFVEAIEFKKKYPEVVEIAINLEGTLRQRGVHAAAVVVSNDDLSQGDSCAFVLDREKEATINWDKEDIEYVGLMKLDILGLKMLSVFNFCLELIEKNTGEIIDLNEIPLDEKICYQEFTKGNAIGCFQLGSQGLRKFCQQVKIDYFDNLMSATSLYRPGPLRSGMADQYIQRKNGEIPVPVQHPIINEITKETYGIVLYQEQLMMLTHKLAGIEWKEVEKIRKLMAKSKGKNALREYEDKFALGCVANNTISETQARDLWGVLETFGGYGFNKAHACAYSIITYWGMWLKINYPIEYICALLTYGSDNKDKRNEYILEAFRLGVDIRPPKIGISEPKTWKIFDGRLYAPFIEIFGIGPVTADKFKKHSEKGFLDEEKISQKFIDILKKINAYEDAPVTDDDAEKYSGLLSFSLIKNKLRKHKNLQIYLENNLRLSKISDVNLMNIDTKDKYYFGEVVELTLTTKNGKDGQYTVVSINFKDNSGISSINIDSKFYKEYKEEVERCEGTVILIKASCPRKAGSLFATEIWFFDDLMSCNYRNNYDINILNSRRFKNKELLDCEDCDLRQECVAPVLPSTGMNSIMIIGEAPGMQEDINKEGFVGDSGKLVWNTLREFGWQRKDFQVSNIVKCYPSRTKTPSKKHIKACSKWLEEELEVVKPGIILAFGNTTIKFFTEEESGIMKKSGTTEWCEKYGCYICWCIHPSAVLRNESNKQLFLEGVSNFCNKLNKMAVPF
ncbi:MAG: DNA polymerase III subunit alpha [Candidatus Thorarchaeota archaeon]